MGRPAWNLARWSVLSPIIQCRSQIFLGGTPLKNFRGQKHVKFGPISDDFEVRRRISSKRIKILWWRKLYIKSDNNFIYRDFSCVRRNKSGEVWSSNLGDLDVNSYPPKAPFSENHISAPRECCAPKFLHALENEQFLLAHPSPVTQAPLTIFFKGCLKIALNVAY